MAVVGGRFLFKMPTMNEVSGVSSEQETVERTVSLKQEMATAQGLHRPFLPLKRKPFAYSEEEELLGFHHQCKRFLSEELMAAHLRHLNLSSESNTWTTTSSVPVLPTTSTEQGRLTPYPCHLNIKTVASCPQSLDSQVGRKRSFPDPFQECCMEEDVGENESMEVQVLPRKRTKLDPGMDSKCINFKSDSRVGHSSVRSELDALHGMSDLSSIPEEGEPALQISSPVSPVDQISSNPITGDISIDTDDDNDDATIPIEISQPVLPSPQSLHLSPKSPAGPSGEVQSVWLAPELKTIMTHADCPLPLSILKEIRNRSSRGMELVPWVGGLHTAIKDGQKQKESKASTANSASEKLCKESMETN